MLIEFCVNKLLNLLFSFSDVVEISGQHFGTFDIIANVDFLILRVSAIIGGSHRQQHDRLTSHFL